MVRFSSNIVVVSIIIVGFTLNYGSAEKTDPPDGKKNLEEPKPEKEVLSRKEFTGKGAFGVGIENTVEMVNGNPVIKQTLFGHIGGQLSISRTLLFILPEDLIKEKDYNN
eukprot:XP_016661693.1 PREDICTED: uncharacterized protein LOC107884346 [Acyrthosiphon pisum]